MALAPALDLRPLGDGADPANIEAEQALIGVVLYDNEAFHAAEDVRPEQFREPLHARLWLAIGDRVAKGVLADPTLLARIFADDQAFKELGGVRYLADLVDAAPPSSSAAHYAVEIIETAQRRALIELSQTVASQARRPGDPAPVSEIIEHAEASLLAMQVGARGTVLTSAVSASANVLAALDSPQERGEGIVTGVGPLDTQLGPLLPGDLVLLQGRPSMGKSAAAECFALNIALPDVVARTGPLSDLADMEFVRRWQRDPAGVIQVNGEMTPEQMARRHLSDLCFHLFGAEGPKYSDIRKRNVTTSQRDMLSQAHALLDGLPLTMLKRPGLKLAQLRSLTRRQAATWSRQGVKLGALIVDHVGLLRTDHRMDRYEAQTEISNGLKELADELGCVIFGLNQMNRENEKREDKRPQLSDLRDSGSWEQDADFVIGFYRESYYASREPEPKAGNKPDDLLKWEDWDRRRKSKAIEAIVLKAREGECGVVKLWGDVSRNAIRATAPSDGGML